MQNSKLLVILALYASFNGVNACEQSQTDRKAIEIAALEAIQRHDTMIQDNDDRKTSALWSIATGLIVSSIIIPLIDKNVTATDFAITAGFATTLLTTTAIYDSSTRRKNLDYDAAKELKIHAEKLGINTELIEQMHNPSDFMKEEIRRNLKS